MTSNVEMSVQQVQWDLQALIAYSRARHYFTAAGQEGVCPFDNAAVPRRPWRGGAGRVLCLQCNPLREYAGI